MHTPRRPFTTPVLAVLGLTCVLGPACAPAHAQSPAVPATTSPAVGVTYTYVLARSGRRVTLKNGAGKTVLDLSASTPTLRMVAALGGIHTPAPSLSLTLENAGGMRLWSSRIPVSPRMHTMQFTFQWNEKEKAKGTKINFAFSPESSGSHSDDSDAPPLVLLFGADGQMISAKAGEMAIRSAPGGMTMTGPDGAREDIKTSAHGVTATAQDGSVTRVDLTAKGGTMEINGETIPIKPVRRDGKSYLSFPWNGHDVLIEDGCTFKVSTDGTLLIDAPGPTAKSAGK